jgi:phosphatidylserine/phosphatidylglycerophosphate/cardiolipin synthase-like enzyme
MLNFRTLTLALSAAFTMALTGCGAAAFHADSTAYPDSTATTLTLRGNVHGGQQPISGAQVRLYHINVSTEKGAAVSMLTTPGYVTTGTDGSFSITGKYTCGSATMVYLVATGGQPTTGTTNSNITLITALGACSNLTSSTFVSINELTTVAAAAALAPYAAPYAPAASPATTPAAYIGTSSSQGETNNLTDQFTLAGELVNTQSGGYPGANIPTGWSSPSMLINTLGNILAACVNSGGVADTTNTSCTTLFNNTPGSDGTVPVDTFTAIVNLLNHPTANRSTLFNLQNPQAPFAPSLGAAPTTFDVALQPPAFTVTRTLYTFPDLSDTTTYGFSHIYSLINAATTSIDITIYDLADTTAVNDLVAACNRGVIVRAILDSDTTPNYTTNGSYNTLNATPNGSAVKSNPQFSSSHEKAMVFDNTTLAILTANLVSTSYSNTRDFVLITNDPQDIAAVEDTFTQDYGSSTDHYYSNKPGNDLLWSPTSAQTGLLAIINNATTSVTVENEEMSASNIITALTSAAARGVNCQVIMTYTTAIKSYLNQLLAGGCNVRTYANSVSQIYIHAKVILADAGTPAQLAYLGSINFSTTSMLNNRELGTVLTDSTILAGINTTLTADFNGATVYTTQ